MHPSYPPPPYAPPPGPLAVVEIELSYFPLMWILHFLTPSFVINGLVYPLRWGLHRFDLPAGRYHFEAFYPYLFSSRTSPGRLMLDLVPGGTYRLRYRPAWVVFLNGSLRVVAQPALPAAHVHQLPR